MTDSENVCAFLSKGSPKPAIQKLVFECNLILHDLECSLEPIHLLRSDPRIQLVDSASKTKDTDNWSIDYASFKEFDNDFQL
jgi:hypothetical protein